MKSDHYHCISNRLFKPLSSHICEWKRADKRKVRLSAHCFQSLLKLKLTTLQYEEILRTLLNDSWVYFLYQKLQLVINFFWIQSIISSHNSLFVPRWLRSRCCGRVQNGDSNKHGNSLVSSNRHGDIAMQSKTLCTACHYSQWWGKHLLLVYEAGYEAWKGSLWMAKIPIECFQMSKIVQKIRNVEMLYVK